MLAIYLSNCLVKRGWITENTINWCVYALEKRFNLLSTIVVLLAWMIISHLYIETLAFLVPFYLLRRRIGGWHAKSALFCFALSVGLVIFACAFLGKVLVDLPLFVLLAIDTIMILIVLFLQPEYPPQVRFSADEKAENYRIKNDLVALVSLIQCFTLVFFDRRILAYSLCAIVFCVTAVLVQKLKGGFAHEET